MDRADNTAAHEAGIRIENVTGVLKSALSDLEAQAARQTLNTAREIHAALNKVVAELIPRNTQQLELFNKIAEVVGEVSGGRVITGRLTRPIASDADAYLCLTDLSSIGSVAIDENNPSEFVRRSSENLDRIVRESLQLKVSILSPAVLRGTTEEEICLTCRKPSFKHRMLSDTRNEPTPNGALSAVKWILGEGATSIELKQFVTRRSFKTRSVLVNPYACFSSGYYDYEDVVNDHFYRWHFDCSLEDISLLQRLRSNTPFRAV